MRKSTKTFMVALLAAMSLATWAKEVTVGVSVHPGDKQMDFYKGFFQMLGKYTSDTYRFVFVKGSDRIAALEAGQVDVVIPLERNDETKSRVRFGHPYLTVEMSALLRRDAVRNLKGLADKTACVTTRAETRAAESYGAKAVHFSHWQDKFKALEDGRCVATFGYRTGNEIFLKGAPARKKQFKHIKKFWTGQAFRMSFAVAKRNASLLKGLNKALSASKHRGEYDALIRHFYASH